MQTLPTLDFDDLAESRELREFLDIVRRLTGILVALISPDRQRVKRFYPTALESPLCRLIHRQPKGPQACLATDQYHLKRAAHKRQSFHYLCHAGLIDMVIPIYVNDWHVATMNCGQILPQPPSKKGFTKLCRRLQPLRLNRAALRKAYFQTPACSLDQIQTIVKLLSFFAEYYSEAGWRLKQMRLKDRLPIQQAQKYIHNYFPKPIKLKDIAQAAGLSPAYLSFLFHQRAGMKVTAYLQFIRIQAARKLLAQSSARITDIAFDVGFNNLTHFNRVFRKMVHVSPRAYRRRTKPQPGRHPCGKSFASSRARISQAFLMENL